ncbi:MAG TPA: hypothetical protein VMJ34_18060 [Bryobacteraceae bacterium]|nr:hypothetical protein [Bryobacteraceae bacterium]
MRAIALSAAVLVTAVFARADAHADVIDVIASMTAALSDDNAAGFMKAVDKGMSGYDTLRGEIPALLAQGNVVSSVQALRDEGDDARRSLQLDWYLEIRNLDETAPVVRRREVIRCTLEKHDGRWHVTSLDPLSFFEPENYTHK